MEHSLKVISWNITRRCNLSCNHCYLPAIFRSEKRRAVPPPCELSTEKALQVIDQIAHINSEVMLILSGGEPLLRKDVFELAAYASGKGMMVVLGTNGMLLDNEVALKLKQSGVTGLSISVDSANPEVHDWSRLVNGAWMKAVKAVHIARDHDLSVQINTVVTKNNYNEMAAIIQFARSLGASVFSPFFLVCTGKGEELTDISPVQYEEILSMIIAMQRKRGDMMIRTRCAPTFRRILYQHDPESSLLKLDAGKCMAGLHYCRITPEGVVTPCPYMNISAGKLRNQGFHEVWRNSDVFHSLRNPSLRGKCGNCEFSALCGGCRARACAASGNIMAEDPWCAYSPKGLGRIKPPVFDVAPFRATSKVMFRPEWSDQAEDRLKRVPFFVRSMVRGAVERYAVNNNHKVITPEIMLQARKNYGMEKMSRQ